jgi:hypothetical protein
MSKSLPGVSLPPEIVGQINVALQDLLREIPTYGTVKLEIISHGGVIKRVKTTKEVQTELG